MGTLLPKMPAQTLYVTVHRDELRRLKEEREQLQQQVAQLSLLLQQARRPVASAQLSVPRRVVHLMFSALLDGISPA